MSLTEYKIYCADDVKFEYVVDVSTPTECPTNAAHTIRGVLALKSYDYVELTASDTGYRMYDRSVLADTTAGNITINLPPAISTKNHLYVIKKTAAANTVTLDGYNPELIDGATTYTMTSLGATIKLVSNGTSWDVYALNDVVPDAATTDYSTHNASEHQVVVSPINSFYPSDYTSIAAAFAAGAVSVFAKAGVYIETADIVIPDRGQLIGEAPGKTIIVLAAGNSIVSDGSGGVVEMGGTVSIANNSTAIVGTGTTFTNLSPGNFISLGTNFYTIASITDDTHLTLADVYVGAAITDSAYCAQPMNTAVRIAQLSVTGSSTYGIRLRGVRHGSMYAVGVANCNPCVEYDHCSDMAVLAVIPQYSAGVGMYIKDSISMSMNIVNAFNNTSHGIEISGKSVNVVLNSGACENNNGCGVNILSPSSLVNMTDCIAKNNNSHGIQIATGVTCCTINNTEIVSNNGMGLNSAAINSVVSASTIGQNTSHGMSIGLNTIADGNKILYNGGHGVNVTGDYVKVSDSIIGNNTSNGVNVSANYVVINGNTITNNLNGVYANNSTNCVVTGNTFKDDVDTGLELDGTSVDAVITGNTIDACDYCVMLSSGSDRAIINSNHIGDATTTELTIKSSNCVLIGNIVDGEIILDVTATNTQVGLNRYTTLTNNGPVDSNLPGFNINELDARSAATLKIGKSTATKIELADTGVTTEIKGALTALEGLTVTGTTAVTGDITVTGTVDGRDLSADGTALDNHTASTSNPHSVTKAQVGLSEVQNIKSNFAATSSPSSTNDNTQGYTVGSLWVNTSAGTVYICVDSTTTNAIWKQLDFVI